jgi:beta-fructofuranosidase
LVEHRPAYHLLPASGWMNDPNGPIQWRGDYHLFYQHNPRGAADADKHWAHAVSTDLVHWERLPIALAPGPGDYDAEGIWSGCVADADGTPAALYTGHPSQTQCVAFGSDDLVDWRKHEANPVVCAPPGGMAVTGFRDPFAWAEGDGWRMVVGSGMEGVGGAALLYESDDLLDWRYLGPLCVGRAGETGVMWECPNFFPLGDRHVLVVSPYGKAIWQTGRYDGERFEPERRGLMDIGGSYYAPNCLLDDAGRRIMWGWITDARSETAQLEAGWSGVMSLPRELSLADDGSVAARPVPELEALRGAHRRCTDVDLRAGERHVVEGVEGDCLEVLARFEPGDADAVGLKLRCSPDGEEQTAIVCDRRAGRLQADRERSSCDPECDCSPHGDAVELTEGEPVTLHVFLDRSVVEVFLNDRVALTTREYPTRDDSVGLELLARGGGARVTSLDVWELHSIWS